MNNMQIKTLAAAEKFLSNFNEFTHHDFFDGEFWFRNDGPTDEFKTHEYTINHETEGIIGVTKEEAIRYVYRNRKRLNHANPYMAIANPQSNY